MEHQPAGVLSRDKINLHRPSSLCRDCSPISGDHTGRDFQEGLRRRRDATAQARLEVSTVCLGCATMTPFYDEPDEEAAIDTLRRSREIGIDFLPSTSLRKLAYHSVTPE
jgi:hypothetical protein